MERILTTGIKKIDPNKFKAISYSASKFWDTNWVTNKPDGGLWGSTYTPEENYPSDWVDWCVGDFYNTSSCRFGVSYELNPNGRVCEITSVEDYRSMMKTYGRSQFSPADNAPKWGNITTIDWVKLAKDYDAFHITRDAFLQMRLPSDAILELEHGYLANFYAYDCESWIIFNLDCIDPVTIRNHTFSFDEY